MSGKKSHSLSELKIAIQAFYDKQDTKNKGGGDFTFGVTLISGASGEISACMTKCKSKVRLAEECAEQLVLFIGSAMAAAIDLGVVSWNQIDELMERPAKIIDGRIRGARFQSA